MRSEKQEYFFSVMFVISIYSLLMTHHQSRSGGKIDEYGGGDADISEVGKKKKMRRTRGNAGSRNQINGCTEL